MSTASRRVADVVGWALPLGVLLLAFSLRFWNLEATEFKYDEARLCNLAARFVEGGPLPARGMSSSIGVDNPPLAVYLIAIPVRLSHDPLVVTSFVALLNVIGVWGCYWLGCRYWGRRVGLTAALLLAVSPWAVFYSRKVWAQDMLLPFVVLFFYLLMAWFVEGRRWALGGAVIALAALTQIHMATVAFVPVLVLLMAVSFRRREERWWKSFLTGLSVGLAMYIPYLAADALDGWRNVRTLLNAMRNPARWHPEAFNYALLNVGGREIHALAGPERFQEFLRGIVNLAYLPDRAEEVAVLVSAAYLVWRLRCSGTCRRDGVLLLWLFTPPLFFVRSRMPVFPHYFVSLYPAPYLAVAAVGDELVSRLSRRGRAVKAVALGTLLALGAWQGYLSLAINAFVGTHQTPGGTGTPIRVYRTVVGTVRNLSEEWGSRQVVVLCAGSDVDRQECPAVFQFLLGSEFDVRLADRDASLLFPRSETVVPVVLSPGESVAARQIARHATEVTGARVYLREGAGAYRFYRLSAGYVPPPPMHPPGTPARLANGVELLGYEISPLPAPGGVSRLALYWRVVAIPPDPPPQGYSFANHVLAADGRRCGQKDGPGQPVALWRVGDTVISYFDIELPADAPPPPYCLRTGMYVFTPPDRFTAIPVVDTTGRPLAEAVEWPLP